MMRYEEMKARKQEIESKIKQLRFDRLAAQEDDNTALDLVLQEQQEGLFLSLSRIEETMSKEK